ncbi:MAG: transmembrane prediction [Acidobacteria bacterium]|nr:MAG: transmembrane prediction [Acidobacteriota bacterium]
MRRAQIVIVLLVCITVIASAGAAQFQRRGGRFGYGQIRPNPSYDGAWMFCRIMFRNASNGDGGGWAVDYPQADQNLSFRLSELTRTPVSNDGAGNFNHAVLQLTDAATLSHCPFIMMTEPGGTYFDEAEAIGLRTYLQKGGFLWADDFWGEYAWEHWVNEIRKALPSGEYPLIDVPLDHTLFHLLYDVREIPQIPSIGFWYGSGGGTSERGRDSAVPHVRAITDRDGHFLVVMTHNTDFGDAFEREGESREYFERFAGPGYAFGINTLLYAMTH